MTGKTARKFVSNKGNQPSFRNSISDSTFNNTEMNSQCFGLYIQKHFDKLCLKRIERDIQRIPLPNPQQWMIVHTSDFMLIIRQSIYFLNHHEGNGLTENTQLHILYNGQLSEYA